SAASLMGKVIGEIAAASSMEPVQRPVNAQSGFIKVHNLCADKFLPDLFHYPLNPSGTTTIDACESSAADRNGEQIRECLGGSLVGEKSIVLQVDRECLHARSVLRFVTHPFGESAY